MALINYHSKCRLCGHEDLDTFLDMGEHYLHGLFVFPDFQPPIRTIPTELARCETKTGGCGLVQLKHSVDADVLYSRYGYRSATNATMREHLQEIAVKADVLWINKNAEQPVCLDIGCNDGFLSRQFPSHYHKFGIDPCDVGCKITGIDNFTFLYDLFPSVKLDSLSQSFDIITMIACFYDINDPQMVAKELYRKLKRGGILVVEVSYWPTKMEKCAIDEVCHEHVAFYNFQNLEHVFTKAGFRIFDAKLNDINGGSIQLWMQGHSDTVDYSTSETHKNILALKFDEMNKRLDTSEPYRDFAERCRQLKFDVQKMFRGFARAGKTIHLYGASTKGNVLLQYFGLNSSQIPYAAERSKEKWGGKTLGTDIKMISEEESRAMKPDYYFVPIWSFRNEIIKREQTYLSTGGQLIFPLPTLELIGK